MSSTSQSPFKPTDKMLRQFGALWIVFFGVLARLQQVKHHDTAALVIGILAVTIGPMGILWPRGIRPIFVGWMFLAYPIGWTISRVILGLLYYVVFTPVAWVFRLSGRDELRLKPQRDAATYWQTKPAALDKARYLRQF